ncbi:MAG: SIR2 family protein [Casimicrobium sp.]
MSLGYIRVIVTTNFDRLLENALRDAGIEPTVVSNKDSLLGAEPIAHSSCYVLKLHGDYKDTRILNTDSELASYPKALSTMLDRVFDEYGLIVCGWSGEWDHALRAALMRAPNRRYSTYWAVRGAPSDGASALISQRRARVISGSDANALFSGLQKQVEVLLITQKRSPQNIDLLVDSAKLYLSKPEFRIQLDDLVSGELTRLLEQLSQPRFSPDAPISNARFTERAGAYEGITEPLAKIFGVLGRWGDGSELPLVLDCLGALCRHAGDNHGGTMRWLYLRAYPAVLLYVMYGIALLRSGRLKSLHELFVSSINPPLGVPQRLIDTLHLWKWEYHGTGSEAWKSFIGLENRKTALSDHLFEISNEWRSSFFGAASDFESRFDEFEILAALASFESDQESTLETAFASSNGQIFVQMPVGRIGRRSAELVKQLERLRTDQYVSPLFMAGFARNSKRFLELFCENLSRYGHRMSW